jgi:hypothetical protein
MRIRKVFIVALALIAITSTLAGRSLTSAQQRPAPIFFGALNEPASGRVLSGWGQFSSAWDLDQPAGKGDDDDLLAYGKTVAPQLPAMISFYVAPDQPTLEGFLKHYREYAASHGFFVAQIGFYFHGMEHDVAIGMRDPDLWTLADALRDVGRPVLLRVGYEFNNPSALYQTSGYIGAFRHVAELMRKDRATNVATVWDATAIGFSDPNYMKWYPGDDVVDWWGLNLFDPRDFSRPESEAFVADAARHHKPILIGEASPIFQTVIPGRVRGAKSAVEASKWYEAFFEFIRAHPAVKAFSLIAVDWRRLHSILPGKRWPDTRLDKWPSAAALVKKQLADPRFIDAEGAFESFRQSRQK